MFDYTCYSMRIVFLVAVALSLNAADTAANKLWTELKSKREQLPSVHQEFDVIRTFRTPGRSQSSKTQIILDMAASKWREKSVSGSGSRVRMFDGQQLYYLEEGSDEFVRLKRRAKDPDPFLLLTSRLKRIGRSLRNLNVARVGSGSTIISAPCSRFGLSLGAAPTP